MAIYSAQLTYRCSGVSTARTVGEDLSSESRQRKADGLASLRRMWTSASLGTGGSREKRRHNFGKLSPEFRGVCPGWTRCRDCNIQPDHKGVVTCVHGE
jgi:hypothetical protein